MARNVHIGKGLSLPHPHGLLFTEGMEIGEDVCIYGNVRFTRSYNHVPKIGSRVLIGDSAVFTGKGTIGDDSIVGAAAVVTKRFPDQVVVIGNPAVILRQASKRQT